jgi:hypothetical protein
MELTIMKSPLIQANTLIIFRNTNEKKVLQAYLNMLLGYLFTFQACVLRVESGKAMLYLINHFVIDFSLPWLTRIMGTVFDSDVKLYLSQKFNLLEVSHAGHNQSGYFIL